MGETAVPVPGMDDVSFPVLGALGIETDGDVPLGDVSLEAVTGEFRVLLSDEESMRLVVDAVKVCVKVSGNVMVIPPVEGAVGAVFGGTVSLHGVGHAGDDEPVAGLTSVEEESAPDGTWEYP